MPSIKFDYVDKLEISEDEVFDAIRDDYEPDDVFTMETLDAWATENGYVKEDK